MVSKNFPEIEIIKDLVDTLGRIAEHAQATHREVTKTLEKLKNDLRPLESQAKTSDKVVN